MARAHRNYDFSVQECEIGRIATGLRSDAGGYSGDGAAHRPRGMTGYMTDADRTEPRHHLMIAGTGRAGTSLLVRSLAAMGLETHLRVHTEPSWHDDANAGLEDLPLENDRETAPYVVKSPWLSEVIDAVLADPRVAIDGVIIPCRRPRQAQRSQQRASRPIVYGHFRDHTEAGAYACRLPARVPPDKGSATMTI